MITTKPNQLRNKALEMKLRCGFATIGHVISVKRTNNLSISSKYFATSPATKHGNKNGLKKSESKAQRLFLRSGFPKFFVLRPTLEMFFSMWPLDSLEP